LENFNNDTLIVCGDFNLVLNPDLDYYNYANINNPKARVKVIQIIDDKHLIDTFRELHPETKDTHGAKQILLNSQNIFSGIVKKLNCYLLNFKTHLNTQIYYSSSLKTPLYFDYIIFQIPIHQTI